MADVDVKAPIMIKRCEGMAALNYGAETATSLEVTCMDAAGAQHVFTFDEGALRQLAHVLRRIEAEVPGALRGH